MSASSIARWNAIPMSREPDDQSSNKRTRSDDDDNSSEDNVSLVSRSPSPQPDRDVEMKDVYGYDEHVRGVAREVITVETKIKNTNKGFAMLAKMGWAEGTPLGLSGDGRVDPVPFTVKQDSTGLGKATQDFRMIETTVSQRRNLDSERMQFETAEQRQQREAAVAQKAAVKSELSNVLRPFYCELCDKQFQNVAQYDEHTNSYAHHHKARARDMNANHPVRAGGREEAERRREKERKREEKELRKLARAAGIKLSAPPVAHSAASSKFGGEDKGFKKSGWASIDDALPGSTSGKTASSTPAKVWAPVSDPTPSAPSGSPPPPPPPSAPAPMPPIHQGFRSGGWSTLATFLEAPSTPSPSRGVSTPPLPPPPPSASLGLPIPPQRTDSSPLPPPPPPPSLPPSTPSSWSRLPSAPPSSQPQSADHGNRAIRPYTESAPLTSITTGITPTSVPTPPNPQNQPTNPATSNPSSEQRKSKSKSRSKSKMTFDEEATAQSRGNWQNFQKMRGRR